MDVPAVVSPEQQCGVVSSGFRFSPVLFRLLPVLCCLVLAIWQMRYDWTYDETYYYGWTVLPLSLYLFSLRWRDRPAPAPYTGKVLLRLAWAALSGLLVLTWLVREANPDWRLIGVLLAGIAVAAAALSLWEAGGRPWLLHFAGPVLFFLVAVPWPSVLEKATTSVLMPANAAVTLELLHWCEIPAVRSGHLITLPSGTLGVEEACSGIRSLQSTLMMALFLGELNLLSFSARSALLLAGILCALFTNIGRTFGLSAAAAWHGLQAAHEWHDTAGLLALGAIVACLFILTAILSRKRLSTSTAAKSPPPQHQKPETRNQEPGTRNQDQGTRNQELRTRNLFLSPSSIIYVSLVVMFPLTAWWYGRNEGSAAPPWHLAPPVDAPGYHRLPLDPRTMALLRQPRGWSARWNSPEGKSMQGFYFEWEPGVISAEMSQIHNPGVCLDAIGMKMVEELEPISVVKHDVFLSARFFHYEDRGRPLFVLFLVQAQNSQISEARTAWMTFRWGPVLEGRRNEGQRLIEIGLWDVPTQVSAKAIFVSTLELLISRKEHFYNP